VKLATTDRVKPVFSTVLASSLNFQNIPAGDDTVSVDKIITVDVPNVVCDDCTLQLAGMGWFQCANIKIVNGAHWVHVSLLFLVMLIALMF